MAMNEETRQIEIADQLVETVKSLVHSTRTVPKPADSYQLIADLAQAQEALVQVYAQLAAWHGQTVDGTQYNDEDGDTTGLPVTEQAKRFLELAAHEAEQAAAQLRRAHSINGAVRWFGDVTEVGEA